MLVAQSMVLEIRKCRVQGSPAGEMLQLPTKTLPPRRCCQTKLLAVQEGIPTILLGVWIWITLAKSPAEAKFLNAPEREHVARQVKVNKVAFSDVRIANDGLISTRQGALHQLWEQANGSNHTSKLR